MNLTKSLIQQSQTLALWPNSTNPSRSGPMETPALSEPFLATWTVQTRALHRSSNKLSCWITLLRKTSQTTRMVRQKKQIHLRSSETETNLHPSEDHAMRKIEPSWPASLHIWTASNCRQWNQTSLLDGLLWSIWSSIGFVKDGASFWETTFQTRIWKKIIFTKEFKIKERPGPKASFT